MTGILVALTMSTLAILISLTTRRTVKTTAHSRQLRTAPRHAVVRDPAGPRQQPRGTLHQRERIPVQVAPEVEARNARTIEGYDEYGENDDLLMRPFAPAADDTTAVVAVP